MTKVEIALRIIAGQENPRSHWWDFISEPPPERGEFDGFHQHQEVTNSRIIDAACRYLAERLEGPKA